MPNKAETFRPQHHRTASERKREHDQRRGSSAERGYGKRWQRYRRMYLARPENALCRKCERESAVIVDHIVPHKGDEGLFWDPANHQPLCKRCHDQKTATSDGGFGR